jgi:adenine-specific DNA-methyltransferase
MNKKSSIPLDVTTLGQVFTPKSIVDLMLSLRQNHGRTLEPSAGNGAFSRSIPDCTAVEFDKRVAPRGAKVMDFFAYPVSEKFSCVIGNPPYVRYQDIPTSTKCLLDGSMFDGRSNLYLFFIAKAIEHLEDGGELIFITPRDFVKLTAAAKLNDWLFEQGTITHWIETGDTRIFDGALPNCAIFRFVKGNLSRKTLYRTIQDSSWDKRAMVHIKGQLAFTHAELTVPLSDLFEVRVGAVSGADPVFEHQSGIDMVSSRTVDTGEPRQMLYNVKHPSLKRHKQRLLQRRIRRFDESNWWMWGRGYAHRSGPRIYVNGKTRRERPFYVHTCEAYDGSVLALFPKIRGMDLERAAQLLNDAVPWDELGFVVDGRRLFSQRTLETLVLPPVFDELRSLVGSANVKRSRRKPV